MISEFDPVPDDPDIKSQISERWSVLVTRYNASEFPTGTLITSRGSLFSVMYHSNDVHYHTGILVWCTYDGTDRISLRYEPGKTRPMLFELEPFKQDGRFLVILKDLVDTPRFNEQGYRPRDEVLFHPRYLEVVKKLVTVLPFVHLHNDAFRAFMHKWQPLIWRQPESLGFKNCRDYYFELSSQDDLLATGLRQTVFVSSACSDVAILFISLLHEELFIRLTTEEIAQGQVPVKKILIDTDDYDPSRLLRPESELFKVYQTRPELMFRGLYSTVTNVPGSVCFFAPLIFAILMFLVALLFSRPLVTSILGGGLRPSMLFPQHSTIKK